MRDTTRTSSQPERSIALGQPDGHHGEQQQGDHREDDAGAGETGATDAALEGDRGEHHAERRHGRAERLNRRERFAADEDREDHGQPSVRGNDPGDQRDRADAQTREVGQVGSGTDDAEQSGRREDQRVRRQRRSLPERQRDEQDRANDLDTGRDLEAAETPACQRSRHVHGPPRQRGPETGEEPEGDRHSRQPIGATGGRPRADPVLNCATARGDVAQLGEHRVRIAGVRGSSPLISTITPVRTPSDVHCISTRAGRADTCDCNALPSNLRQCNRTRRRSVRATHGWLERVASDAGGRNTSSMATARLSAASAFSRGATTRP